MTTATKPIPSRMSAEEAMVKYKYTFEKFVYIHNRSNFLVGEFKSYHPDTTQYVRYWKEQVKRCIEGFWNTDGPGQRYMPGPLYFYVNFGTILHKPKSDPKTAPRRKIRPYLRDVEWEFFYNWLEARGFSGFEFDEEYTCCRDVLLYSQGKLDDYKFDELNKSVFKKDGTLKTYVPARDYLRRLHSKQLGRPLYDNESQNFFMLGCLDRDEEIRMFDGSLKRAEDIIVGDEVMGIDSTKRTVQELVRGSQQMYNVHSRYNETFTCTGAHILHMLHREYNPVTQKQYWVPVDMQLVEYLELSDKEKRSYQIRRSEAIEYPETYQELDPYFIGLWLGDGFKHYRKICVNQDKDKEILDWLIDYADSDKDRFRYSLIKSDSPLSDSYTTRFHLVDKANSGKGNWFGTTLARNKHIPQNYMIASKKQRMELLAGLIDSDGSMSEDGGRFRFYNIDYDLILQVQELSRSLGFRATITERKPSKDSLSDNVSYYVTITGDIDKVPTKLSYKKAIKNPTLVKGSNINNITIEAASCDNYFGFEIDGDHLFMLKDYQVTHNARGFG